MNINSTLQRLHASFVKSAGTIVFGMKAAREMADKGTFGELASGYPGGELNKMFK